MFEFTYGKVEIKAKLPTKGGTWSALWTLGANIDQVGWPSCGEIDMMEHVGNNPNNIINAIHNSAGSGGNAFVNSTPIPGVAEYHIYGIEWDENQIRFYVDNVLSFTYAPSPKTAANWPYNANQFLLMNIAVGGTLGGAISSDFNEATMEIDYVKFYQK